MCGSLRLGWTFSLATQVTPVAALIPGALVGPFAEAIFPGPLRILNKRQPSCWRCRLAQLNIRRQMHNLINSPPIAGAWKEGKNPVTVHGVLFRIETGMLEV